MGFVRCALPHPIHLVLPERCLVKAGEDYKGIPLPGSAAEVEDDLWTCAEAGVLTLVDEKQPENLRISFCTQRYEVVCGLTQQKDAYTALRLAPLSLRAHNQIAHAAVRLAPEAWHVFEDLPELNQQAYVRQEQPAQSGIEALLAAWKQTRQPARAAPAGDPNFNPDLSSAQLAFLANVDTLIELACQVELEKAAKFERCAVQSLGPAGSARSSGNTQRFQLATPANFRVGEYLRAGSGKAGEAGYDGVVTEANGTSLVIRFQHGLDPAVLQRVEWVMPRISTRQYSIQHTAVNALRNGEALNPRLLALIVENSFGAYKAPGAQGGTGKNNPAQQTLIERALVVPDLLLALGPPGTGKTKTIREIVAREAALGRKVLVTSKNNKAVDNVLEGLRDVQALRIGREEAVEAAVRPLLIDNMAKSMQEKVLDGIQPAQKGLDGVQAIWPQVQQVIDHLAQLAVDWRQAQSGLERERAALSAWQRASHAQVERVLARQKSHLQLLDARLQDAAQRAESARAQLAGLHKLSRTPLVGALFTLMADGVAREWQRAAQQHQQALREARKSGENLRRVWVAYRQFVTASETALQRKQVVVQAEQALTNAQTASSQALDELTRLTASFRELKATPAPKTPADLEALLWEWRKWYEMSMRRRELLGEWRTLIGSRHETLYPTLIRGADVVGATCIGIETDARFEDLEFDLVIADEAGQIQVMDLLVPLVRARRAVLVGDHLQLPPVVEPELTQKIRENEPENQELGEWLEKSLFERLISNPLTPASHKVMLDTQYRMPAQIADFISTQFYAGNYHSGPQKPARENAFFGGSPLVFVDTSREVRHYEMRSEDGQGYYNATEGRLICDLLMAHQGRQVECGVIVPYKKQAEAIRRELRRRQSGLSEDELSSRVATVDSFQGREQDVIIFGFTRSNAEGNIGFLGELRRLNVSLTRARQQLLLVGDSQTLAGASNQDFAQLFKALLACAKQTPKGYLYANELARQLQS